MDNFWKKKKYISFELSFGRKWKWNDMEPDEIVIVESVANKLEIKQGQTIKIGFNFECKFCTFSEQPTFCFKLERFFDKIEFIFFWISH